MKYVQFVVKHLQIGADVQCSGLLIIQHREKHEKPTEESPQPKKPRKLKVLVKNKGNQLKQCRLRCELVLSTIQLLNFNSNFNNFPTLLNCNGKLKVDFALIFVVFAFFFIVFSKLSYATIVGSKLN